MPKEEKVQFVDQLAEILKESNIVIATDYRGLTVEQVNLLRRQLRSKNIKYKVVKNTLARFAAVKAGKQNLHSLLVGPTALAFGSGDITDPAKLLLEYKRSLKVEIDIKGGLLNDQALSAEQVIELSKLPSREILIAKMLAGMQSPIASLMGILNAPLQAFMRILQARIQQIEGE